MTNLEQSRSRIPVPQSVQLRFSLIVTFYLTEAGNRTKNLQHMPLTYVLRKDTAFVKTVDFLQKMLTSAKLRSTSFQVSSIILQSYRQAGEWENCTHATSKRTPKNPTQISVKVYVFHKFTSITDIPTDPNASIN